jgi:hypothetical protein
MKEYHPDVYTGEEDANIIANRLIRAYKVRQGAMPGFFQRRLLRVSSAYNSLSLRPWWPLLTALHENQSLAQEPAFICGGKPSDASAILVC